MCNLTMTASQIIAEEGCLVLLLSICLTTYYLLEEATLRISNLLTCFGQTARFNLYAMISLSNGSPFDSIAHNR